MIFAICSSEYYRTQDQLALKITEKVNSIERSRKCELITIFPAEIQKAKDEVDFNRLDMILFFRDLE
jgi:hypothetical protein